MMVIFINLFMRNNHHETLVSKTKSVIIRLYKNSFDTGGVFRTWKQ